MGQERFAGQAGLSRLQAHMRTLFAERKQGTGIGWDQDYFSGLLHGLSLADAIDRNEGQG